MLELVDNGDLKSPAHKGVRVRIPLGALWKINLNTAQKSTGWTGTGIVAEEKKYKHDVIYENMNEKKLRSYV